MDEAIARLHKAVRTIPDFPQPGIQFKDITPILGDHALMDLAVDALAKPLRDHGITKVAAIESRGFILGSVLANRLGAGFVPIRKIGKLPFDTVSQEYALEYGTDTIEMHADAIHPGDRVLIHDDVIATGGTARAARDLMDRLGAAVDAYSFLIELGALGGRRRLGNDVTIHTVLNY